MQKRVRAMCQALLLPAPVRRYAQLDRIVCNIGGSRRWAAGSVQALNQDDPSDGNYGGLMKDTLKEER